MPQKTVNGYNRAYRTVLNDVLKEDSSQEALRIETPIVIRADDVHGLFSTEPDLAGGFTNIAPFVRTEELSSDVTVYWREFKGTPGKEIDEPISSEMVQVPSYLFSQFLEETKIRAYQWDEEADRWQPIAAWDVVPGMTLLLPLSAGGYSDECGWTGNAGDKPTLPQVERKPCITMLRDRQNGVGWQSLSEHTAAVKLATEEIGRALGFPDEIQHALQTAARWHDAGKAHRRWQEPLIPHAPAGQTSVWGKFEDVPVFRPDFRHEAFSLLAAWKWRCDGNSDITALALYLIASHHGRIRTILRGVGEGDNLFGLESKDDPLRLDDNFVCPVDLSVKRFAGTGIVDWESKTYTPERPSWNAIVGELLGPAWRYKKSGEASPDKTTSDGETLNAVWSGDPAIPENEPRELGPFQLAYFEAVFRAADSRASKGEFVSHRQGV